MKFMQVPTAGAYPLYRGYKIYRHKKYSMHNRHAIIIIAVTYNNAYLLTCTMLLLTMCVY